MNARDVLGVVCASAGFGLVLGSAFCPNWLWYGWGMLLLALLVVEIPGVTTRRRR